MSSAVAFPEVPASGAVDRFGAWFVDDHPRMVGLARRLLDPTDASPASKEVAEQISIEAFARLRHARVHGDDRDTDAVLARVLDGVLDRMVGHPGAVMLHDEVLGPDVDFDGRLPLAELHETLAGMRRWDRRVGLTAIAGGFSPSETAVLLGRPLSEVLVRLGRVSTRLADARRLGLTPVDRTAAP